VSYLVDTNVLSELAKPKPEPLVVAWLRAHEPDLYLSTITIGELRRGIESLPAGKRKTALQSWFTDLCKRMEGRILSFNTSTAHIWGQKMAAWDKKGTPVASLDSQIAATANRHNLTVVTRNVSDFKNTGVKLFNPFPD
jgi:predicted nucleic acid-binding protein